MAQDIFISYSREDFNQVAAIVRVLKARGWTVWWDKNILPGTRYSQTIQGELQKAKVVVVIWSEHSIESDWVLSEADEGLQRKKLLPIRLADVTPPHPFGRIQAVDHFVEGEPRGATLLAIVRGLEAAIGKPRVRAIAKPAEPERPDRPASVPPVPESNQAETPPSPEGNAQPTERAEHHHTIPRRPSKGRPTRIAWSIGSALVIAASIWAYSRTRPSNPVRAAGPPVFVGSARPNAVEFETDPATGCKVPVGWTIVDAVPSSNGWARRVSEPKSGIVLQLIEPGRFLMGSPEDEPGRGTDETQHWVELTRPYYLGITEVTEAQLMRQDERSGGRDIPVAEANWRAAKEFAEAIGCTLPTEAQWEYAARAGSAARWWWGAAPEGGNGLANVFDVSAAVGLTAKLGQRVAREFNFDDDFERIAPAGHFQINAFGLHDMVGNVWEWCLDGYGGDYGPAETVDPLVDPSLTLHVARGGSYVSPLRQTRVACRLPWPESTIEVAGIPKSYRQTGFRVALNLP